MQNSIVIPATEPDPVEQTIQSLRSELHGLFEIRSVRARSRGETITFSGRLLVDADNSYDVISRRFQPHGYSPALRREKGEDVILAMEGIVGQTNTGNPLINILLFVVTIFTTLSAGANLATGRSIFGAFLTGNPLAILQALIAGLPFTITLLGILGIHELGHYIAARLHGVRATLPYFIPMPFGLGTLGAFISLRSPMHDRKVLFDIGLAGPYAGLLAAIPLMLLGLFLSSTNFVPHSYPGITLESLGTSLLMDVFVRLFTDIPPDRTLLVDPVFFAAWLGILLTGINLLPVGQLDGGHAAYALLGRPAHIVALITFGLLIVAGAVISTDWFIWAFFVMLGGLRHSPPMNDISDVGPVRKAIGVMTIALFILIFIRNPFPPQ